MADNREAVADTSCATVDNRAESTVLRRASYIAAIFLLVGATSRLAEVQLEYFQVEDLGQEFVVTWKARVEEDVYAYELTRRTALSNEQFIKVFAPEAHGTEKVYTFHDDQVYKSSSEQLDYRLEVVYTNGLREVITSKSINYTSTAIRRTWGSLKAMFQ